MPLFNAIGQPRWNSPLIRFFGMKIGSAAAPSLAPEIAPSFDVNQQDDPTLPFLRGEQLWSVTQQVSAAVGNLSEFKLANPANSGIIVIVEDVLINGAAQSVTKIANDVTDYASVNTPIPRDTRLVTSPGSSALANCPARFTSRNTTAVLISAPYFSYIPTNQVDYDSPQIVLTAGWAWQVACATANQGLTMTVRFKTRPIPAEELSTG